MSQVEFDPAKRAANLRKHGLDLGDARRVFDGRIYTTVADRRDHGETRFITGGTLDGRFVAIVWTWRDGTRRIISMRHTHADEEQALRESDADGG